MGRAARISMYGSILTEPPRGLLPRIAVRSDSSPISYRFPPAPYPKTTGLGDGVRD